MKAGSSEEVNLWLVETKSQRLKLERDVFLSGYVKAFLLSVSTCSLCKDCATNRESCRYKESVRPSPEGFALTCSQLYQKWVFQYKSSRDTTKR